MEKAAEEIGISLEAFKGLCRTFVEETDSDLLIITSSLAKNDRSEIKKRAHHIKGAALSLEFNAVADCVFSIEEKAEVISSQELEDLVFRLNNELVEIKKVL